MSVVVMLDGIGQPNSYFEKTVVIKDSKHSFTKRVFFCGGTLIYQCLL